MDNTAHISLKVLGEHQHVGCVIGKQGSTISEVQQASEAKIQISGPSDVFPGTTERIIHLSGEMLKVRGWPPPPWPGALDRNPLLPFAPGAW